MILDLWYRDDDGAIVAVCGKNYDCKNTIIAKAKLTKASTRKKRNENKMMTTKVTELKPEGMQKSWTHILLLRQRSDIL